jgi:hypothetical protein
MSNVTYTTEMPEEFVEAMDLELGALIIAREHGLKETYRDFMLRYYKTRCELEGERILYVRAGLLGTKASRDETNALRESYDALQAEYEVRKTEVASHGLPLAQREDNCSGGEAKDP